MRYGLPCASVLAVIVLGGWGREAPPPPLASARDVGAPRFAEGPPAGHTGGFGEPTCQICHVEFDLNAMGGSLAVEGLPDRWEPGRSYALAVVLNSSEMSMAGFQLAARFADGAAAGLLVATGPRVTVVDSTGVPYAQHTPVGTDVDTPERAVWALSWTAPAGGGAVTFNAAANSANGDNSPFGDLIYAYERTVAGPGR